MAELKLSDLKWKIKTEDGVSSPPTVAEGIVYFGGSKKNLYAVDIKTGEEKWKFEIGQLCSSPAVVDGTVYFKNKKKHLYAVDSNTGKLKWNFKTRQLCSSPAVVDGVVYFGTSDNHLYAVDINIGEEKWKFKTGDCVDSLTVFEDVVYFGSGDHLYAVDAETGQEKWKFENVQIGSSPTAVDGAVYCGSKDKHFYALDAKTGEEKWKFENETDPSYYDGIYSSQAVVDGVVYFGFYGYSSRRYSKIKHLYALDAKTGEEKWKNFGDFPGSQGIPRILTVSNNTLLINAGILYAVDINTGEEKWKFKTRTLCFSPAVSDDVVCFSSDDNHLYAVDIKTGEEKWKFKTGNFCYDNGLQFIVDGDTANNRLYWLEEMGQTVSEGVVYFVSQDKHLLAVDIKAAVRVDKLAKKANKLAKKASKLAEGKRLANKGELGPANKIKLRGLFYDYAELFFTLDELKEELENAIKYEVPLSDFILDGFFGCEYEIERYYDDTFFCTGSSGDLVIEDSAGNIITSLQVEDIKTSKVEDEPSDNSDIFRITIEDGYRGDWRKYSLTDAISSESSFDQSLLSFSIMDDGDGSLIKITYDGIELEDYEDVIDARGKSTIIDLEYFDKDGNSKFLDIDMDEKELVKSMK